LWPNSAASAEQAKQLDRSCYAMGKPAAKQGDKITATDTHIILIPSPGGPVPTPTPMPFLGTIMSGCSTDVLIEGKPAAIVDSVAVNQPIHIPAGGPFQKPPSNQGKIIMGSTGVFINGKPAARQGDQAITCNDPSDLPIGQVIAVGTVFIGETGAGAPVKPLESQKPTKLIQAKIGQQGKITSAKWAKNRAKCGEAVEAIVETNGFEDGTPADFIIWEKDVDGRDDFIAKVQGEVRGNKVTFEWKYSPEQLELDLQKEVEEQEGEPEYYFSVDIEGNESRSKLLTLTHTLEICLETELGEPLDGVKYTVTLSDGQKRTGKLKSGKAIIEDAPYGEFSVEVEGFYFITKDSKGAKKENA
jgi:uncharacterized Zn-binding protein involved in type VI secretion